MIPEDSRACLLRVFAVAALSVSLKMGARQWQREDAGQLFCSDIVVRLGTIYLCLFYFSRASVEKTKAKSSIISNRRDHPDIVLVVLVLLMVNLKENFEEDVKIYRQREHGTTTLILE